MPLPAMPVLFGPAAASAAKAAAYEYLPTVSSAALAGVLARMAWNRVPDWIRDDVSFRKRGSWATAADGETRGEMERLSSVLEKLQALVESAHKKLGQQVPYLAASLLAYVQLIAQLRRQGSINETRNALYHSAGKEMPSLSPCSVLPDREKLIQALDFSTWAYSLDDEAFLKSQLEPLGYSLIQRSVATHPGSVGYFMAVSEQENNLVIAVKGTSSLEDLFTDTCGRSVSYHAHLDSEEELSPQIEVRARIQDEIAVLAGDAVEIVSGHERIWIVNRGDDDDESSEDHVRCHEGIFISSQRLAEQVQSTVNRMVVQGGYNLMLAGHSLGASAVCLLAVILRSRFAPIVERNKMHVFAFAPPPVLDHDTAVAASSYITSVVNNSDLIVRSSLANLAIFLEVLRSVSQRLQEKRLCPTTPRASASFLRMLAQGKKGEPLMSLDELICAMDAAHEKVELRRPDHLYVPGRVLLLYQDWGPSRESYDDGGGDDDDDGNPSKDNQRQWLCSVTDGTAAVLRFFEIDGFRMLGDHTTAAYYDSVDALVSIRAS